MPCLDHDKIIKFRVSLQKEMEIVANGSTEVKREKYCEKIAARIHR